MSIMFNEICIYIYIYTGWVKILQMYCMKLLWASLSSYILILFYLLHTFFIFAQISSIVISNFLNFYYIYNNKHTHMYDKRKLL